VDDRSPLPQDWQTQIARAYRTFGATEPGATEFGIKGTLKNYVKGIINNPEFEKKINRVEKGRFGRKPRADLDLGKKDGLPDELPPEVSRVPDMEDLAPPERPSTPKRRRHTIDDGKVQEAAAQLHSKINNQPRPGNRYTTPEALELLLHGWLNSLNIDSRTTAELRGAGLEDELQRLDGSTPGQDPGPTELRSDYNSLAETVAARLVSDALKDVPFEDLHAAVYAAWHATLPGKSYAAYKELDPRPVLAAPGPGHDPGSRAFWDAHDPDWGKPELKQKRREAGLTGSKLQRVRHDAEPGKKYTHLALNTATGKMVALNTAEPLQDRYADGKVVVVEAGTPEATTMLRDDMVKNMLSWWTNSSNDELPAVLALQQVMDEKSPDTETAPWEMSPATKMKTNMYKEKHGDLLKQSLDAQEASTRELLGALGIRNIRLFRGMTLNTENIGRTVLPRSGIPAEELAELIRTAGEGEAVSLRADVPLQRPLSSWSRDAYTAESFSFTLGDDDVAAMTISTVDAGDVFSTPLTGMGGFVVAELVTKRGGQDTTLILRKGERVGAFGSRLRGVPYGEGQFIAVNVDVGDDNADWIKAVEQEAREAQAAARASRAAFRVPDTPEEAAQLLAAVKRGLVDAKGPMRQELSRQVQELRDYLRQQRTAPA
jgi:hypothetical protein